MQLPAELQKFLLQPAHLDPELAGHFEKREVIHGLGQLQELAAARAEVRAECALVAAPANEGRIRECRGGTHKLLFKKSPEGTKKSGWRVRLPTTCQARLCVSPAGTESEAK